MSYLHRFGPDDKFHKQLKTHPQFKVTLYSGSAYINDRRNDNVGMALLIYMKLLMELFRLP